MNLDEPVSLEQKLIHDYGKSFGHPVPGYALRRYPSLVTKLQQALKDNQPIAEFKSHVPNKDVTDEIYSQPVGRPSTG